MGVYKIRQKYDPHFVLACAILQQAILDYKHALRIGNLEDQESIEQFMQTVAPRRWKRYKPKLHREVKIVNKGFKTETNRHNYQFDFDIQELDTIEVGQRLKAARLSLGLGNSDTYKLPVSKYTVARYEGGAFKLAWPHTNASMRIITKLAAAYHIDLNYILFGG